MASDISWSVTISFSLSLSASLSFSLFKLFLTDPNDESVLGGSSDKFRISMANKGMPSVVSPLNNSFFFFFF